MGSGGDHAEGLCDPGLMPPYLLPADALNI
jgi:hypothetical protein